MPTSRIVDKFPPAVCGTAGLVSPVSLLRCSFGGRCRDGGSGDVGSFFTTIFGNSLRLLLRRL